MTREGLFYHIMVDVNERPEGWNKELYEKLSYEYLIECAKKHKIEEWNQAYGAYLHSEWERIFPDERYDPERISFMINRYQLDVKIFQEKVPLIFVRPDFNGRDFIPAIGGGANFSHACLCGANFWSVNLEHADFTNANLICTLFGETSLNNARFTKARMNYAVFREANGNNTNFDAAHLQGAEFHMANLYNPCFSSTNLEGADFSWATIKMASFLFAKLGDVNFTHSCLEKVTLMYIELRGLDFSGANLSNAYLVGAHFQGANLSNTHLEGADFTNSHIEGAKITFAVVNGGTLFSNITIDDKTDFTGTSLSSARIDPELRTKLERNIRQIRWEEWYKDNKILAIPARVFWKISDYGSSTRAILFTFLFSNGIFMMFYLALRDAVLLDGSILSSGNDLLLAYMQTTLVPFGILGIDLTTLSLFPVFIIFVQVIFGYTILAALVTRMAIMFQNLSP